MKFDGKSQILIKLLQFWRHFFKNLFFKHQDGFQRELTLAVVEIVLQRAAKVVDNQDVVIALDTIPVRIRNTFASGENA